MISFVSRLRMGPKVLFAFRLFAFISLLVNFSFVFLVYDAYTCVEYCAKYLSYWGYLMTTAFFGFSLENSFEKPHTNYSKLLHCSFLMEVLITIIYWVFIFEKFDFETSFLSGYIEIAYHTLPMLLILIEMLCGNTRLNRNSFYPFITLFLVYASWNAFLTLVFRFEIYKIFTWNNLLTYMVCGGALVFSLALWKTTLSLQRFKFDREVAWTHVETK